MNRKITAAVIALALLGASGWGLYTYWLNNDKTAATPAAQTAPESSPAASDTPATN